MNLQGLALSELAAFVSEHLRRAGIEVVVVGGSAITAWAPEIYTSSDIDFAVPTGESRRTIKQSLAQIGFAESGRIFVHPECEYTLDFVATTPHIDRRPILEFAEVHTSSGSVRVYHLADAILDRVAHFVHWSDDEALRVAERTVSLLRTKIRSSDLESGFSQLQILDRASALRLDLAARRLTAAVKTP